MKQLRILVDFDEVLDNLLERWVAYLNAKYNKDANFQDLRIWDLTGIFPMLTKEEVNLPLYDNALWEDLSPRPDSIVYLKKMIDDGHDVLIVTSSVYQTIPAKMDWLFKHYPYLSWENVIISRRKQLLEADVLIDDGIHNLEGGNYLKLLYDSPNNREYDAEGNGMIRVYSLKEAYNIIIRVFST